MTPYDQKTPSYRLATFLTDHPYRAIMMALVLFAILVPGLSRLGADFSYRIWFRDGDPLLERFDAFERRFGNDEVVAVLVHSPDGIFDQDSVSFIQELTAKLWRAPEVIRVDSLSNYNWTHAEEDELIVEPLLDPDFEFDDEALAFRRKVALEHEIIPGYLISEDANTTVLYAQLKPAIGGNPDFEAVLSGIRDIFAQYNGGLYIDPLRESFYPGPGEHQLYMTGPAAISLTFKEVTQADMQVMVPVLLGAVVLFLLLSFRKLSGLTLPFVVIISSILMTLGAAGWVGVKFNNLTSIVPHILIAISLADSVHILVTFFQFRKAGLNRRDATHKTLVKNLQPTLLTSVSTSIGFFSFSSAEIIPIVQMGLLAGIGTLLAWAITIFLMTPLMMLLPIKVKTTGEPQKLSEPHPLAVRYATWLNNNRVWVLGAFVIIVGGSIYLALKNEINSNPFKYFAEDVHTRSANDFAEDHVGGMMAFEIVLDAGIADGIKDPIFLKKAEAFQDYLNSLPHISKTVGIVDIIKQSNRSLNGDQQAAYILPDNQELIAQELFLYTMSLPQGMDLNNRMTLTNDMIRLSAMSSLHESRQSLVEIEKIEAKAAELGLKAEVTGKMPLYHGMNPYVVSAFVKSISMALILVSLLMMLTLRSVSTGLMSMIPNTVPLIIGGAAMTLLGKPMDIGTVLVTSTCLGIAVDDTIHFLSNYNRWKRLGSDPITAVAHVLTHTGPALFVTTLVLVAAFATFAFARFVPNINFGIITAIVLSTALITDVTLLPALLMSRKAEQLSETREMVPVA